MNPSIRVAQWKQMTFQDLQKNSKLLYEEMLAYQKISDYVNAENYRELHENCQNYIQERKLQEMSKRHQMEQNQNNESRMRQLRQFNKSSEIKLKQFNDDNTKLMQQLSQKYRNEQDLLRLQLQKDLPTKVKQSNQLLNLRKMQQHASKQKNFVEAKSIKDKVDRIYQQQFKNWMEARQSKIQSSLKSLMKKQDAELQGINRRIKLALEDLQNDRVMGELHINQRYDVMLKQLKASHQRQVLGHFGELRNSGGISPSRKNKKQKQTEVSVN